MTTIELIEKHGIGNNCLSDAYELGRKDAIDEFKNIWDERVKDLIDWCKDKRLIGLQQADFIFDEIAEQLKEKKE